MVGFRTRTRPLIKEEPLEPLDRAAPPLQAETLPSPDRAAEESAPLRGWVIFGLFSSLTTFATLVSFSFGVMLPEIRKDIAISAVAAGSLASIFSLFNSLMAVPISNWFSRYNPVRLVAIAGVLGAVFLLLQSFAWSFATLFVSRFLFVLFQSIKNPARAILMQQWLPLRLIGLANGVGYFIHGLTQAFGITLAIFVVIALGGWRITYMAMAAVMGLQIVLWMVVARQRRTASFEAAFRSQKKTPLAAVLKYRQFWLMAVGLCGGIMPWAAFLTFLPTFLQEQRGASPGVAGVTTGMLYVGMTVGSLAAGILDRFVPDRRHLVAGSAVLLVVFPILILTSSSPSLIIAFAFANGLGWGMFPVIQTLPFHLPGVKPREVAVLSGLIQTGTGLGMGLGPLIAGTLTEATGSLFAVLLVLSCLPTVLFVSALLYPRQTRMQHAEPKPAG